MWRKVLVGLLVAGVVALGLMAWEQHQRVQAAEVEAAKLAVERDRAEEEAARALAQADSARAVSDSLEALREAERARAEARARELAARADSLELAIVDLVPADLVGEEVSHHVAVAVGELRESYEERLADQAALLRLSDETVVALREAAVRDAQVQENLRQALALSRAETEAWRVAAQPDFFGRVKGNGGLLAGALAVGVLATVLAGG